MIVRPRSKMAQPKTASVVAEEAMLGEAPPRRSSRAFVRLPARTTDGSSRREYVAFVRDISSTGAFFYAEFNPKHGQRISIEVEYWNEHSRIRLRITGKVVRVEQPAPTAATGIGMVFDSPRNDLPRRPNQAK
jgi:PilZ domain